MLKPSVRVLLTAVAYAACETVAEAAGGIWQAMKIVQTRITRVGTAAGLELAAQDAEEDRAKGEARDEAAASPPPSIGVVGPIAAPAPPAQKKTLNPKLN